MDFALDDYALDTVYRMINNGVSVTGQHEQVWATVNALVDRGVRELIAALSAYPSVRTLESCEGNDDSAWVCFDCGEEDWKALSEFVLGVIGPTLIADFGNRVELRVYITSGGFYRAEMTVCKAVISAVSETVKRLAINAKAA